LLMILDRGFRALHQTPATATAYPDSPILSEYHNASHAEVPEA
jgi:hypothetical protein